MSVYQIHGLKEKLKLGRFVTTVELEPPKGADPMPVMETAAFLRGHVDAVNIADSPMATMRMSPIALAHIIQQDLGIEAIFHLTCRDRNTIGLQSELLGASALGVKNILTLTGDPATRGDHPDANSIFEVDAVGLAKLASRLNNGMDLSNKPLNAKTNFFIGGAANPGFEDLNKEVERLKEKIDAGIQFVQTQPVFDIETVERFLDKTAHLPLHIIFGLLPLKSYKTARFLNEKVPGIHISSTIMERVEKGGRKAGVEITQELLEKLRDKVQGVHLFPMSDLQLIKELLQIEDNRRQVM